MSTQTNVLLCGLLVFALCGLFPPWLYTLRSTGTGGRDCEKAAGHCFLFVPPAPEVDDYACGIRLDIQTLLVEWLCLGAITGAGWLLAAKADNRKETKA